MCSFYSFPTFLKHVSSNQHLSAPKLSMAPYFHRPKSRQATQ